MPTVIVINGTPGTGKTTVAEEIKRAGFKIIKEKELTNLSKCITGHDEKRDAYIIDEDCYEEFLRTFLLQIEENLVFYEGHMGDLVPSEFVERCYVLSLPIEILRRRLEEREYNADKIEENILSEIMKDCLIRSQEAFGVQKTVEIINHESSRTANYIIQEIKTLLRNKNG